MDTILVKGKDGMLHKVSAQAMREAVWSLPSIGDPIPAPKPGIGSTIAAATKAAGVKPCGGCAKRQAALDRATPNWIRRIARKVGGFLIKW